MILATFRRIPLPSYLFYDNNCSLYKHLDASDNPEDIRLKEEVGLPVDVFHFKSKHREGDIVCGTHCNPASFAELIDGDQWIFNSSIAEQTNVWFGGYRAIVREMRAVRYRFFLDEMILRRNRYTVARLAQEHKAPHHRPFIQM